MNTINDTNQVTFYHAVVLDNPGGYLNANGDVAVGWENRISTDRSVIEAWVALTRAKHPNWCVEIRSGLAPSYLFQSAEEKEKKKNEKLLLAAFEAGFDDALTGRKLNPPAESKEAVNSRRTPHNRYLRGYALAGGFGPVKLP